MPNSQNKSALDLAALAAVLNSGGPENALARHTPANELAELLSSALGRRAPAPPVNALAGILGGGALSGGLLGGKPANALAGILSGIPQPTPKEPDYVSLLALALENHRPRNSWNDRFSHWEKPATVSETGTIERAQATVQRAIAPNAWLSGQKVEICRQGSYHNQTNVRTEADIDLRAVHPAILIHYAPNVLQPYARSSLAYTDLGLTYQQIFDSMRSELMAVLRRQFGAANVTLGKKLSGLMG